MFFKTVAEILEYYKVKSYKETNDDLIAIKKDGFWHYFRYEKFTIYPRDWGFRETGTTLKFEK